MKALACRSLLSALVLLGAGGLGGLLAPGALAAPPANDDFANAQVISGLAFSVTGTNVGATAEPGEPAHAGDGPAASVWYSWTAPLTERVSIDTCPSNFDTLLAVYTGTTVNALTPRAANDEGDDCPGSQSQVTLAATAGTTYRIAVDGFGGDTGSITLRLVRPANDLFANAGVLSGFSASASGTNANATVEAGEPAHAGAPAARSVWYRWIAPGGGFTRIGTCASSFDTRLGVYTGASVGGLTGVTGNDDAPNCGNGSLAGFLASAGSTYRIAVDGNGGAQGSFNLKLNQTRPGRYRGRTEFIDAKPVRFRIPASGRTVNGFTLRSELTCRSALVRLGTTIRPTIRIRSSGKFSKRLFGRLDRSSSLAVRISGELLPPDGARGRLRVILRIRGLGRCTSFPKTVSWTARHRG